MVLSTYAIDVPDRMKEEFEERIDAPLLNLYGITENMSVVSTAPLTADYGRFDEDDYLYFVDRKKNIIEARGENVSEQEVEYVLEAHEGVGEAAVVGVPHEIYGEVVKAHVKRSGPDLTAEVLLDHAEANLADFKMPAEMEFVDDFPRTTVGKIAKKELRDE